MSTMHMTTLNSIMTFRAQNLPSEVTNGLRSACCALCGLLTVAVLVAPTAAQPALNPTEPLAFVGDQPITRAEVDLQLGRVSTADNPVAALPPALEGTTIHLIALQRQALQTLREMKQSVAPTELDKWFEEHPITDEQRSGPGEESIRQLMEFRLSWQPYLAKHLTDQNVQRHFDNQRQRFDGTLFNLEMISTAVPPGTSPARQVAVDKLLKLRQQAIENGDELSVVVRDDKAFELLKAAKLRGSGDLHPTLIDTVLKLKKNEWSQPVHSPVGVHVIHLIDVTAGTRELSEVEGEVRAHMLYFLLEHLAAKSSKQHPLRPAEQP